MSAYLRIRPSFSLPALAFCAAFFASGCGPKALVPVAGKVSVEGGDMAAGTLRYVPDKAKGNTLPSEPIAQIGADGTYQLATDGKPGAPPGAYKVVVFISKPSNPADPYSLPVSLINKKYSAPETTDLAVEVVDKPAPGAYDLKLSR